MDDEGHAVAAKSKQEQRKKKIKKSVPEPCSSVSRVPLLRLPPRTPAASEAL